ncbi:hypothetical protein CDV50_13575 [Haematobacter massiliensis]|uniref:Uncharacterized protein n=2 Tax=Alphaproteobacteria TaxID=28211 RepID=A0A5P2QP73_9RHOB|nr:hypothetical protein F9L03_23525 [Brucella lupini]OWJ70322.1 hypothetical protein CDV50_13575 [Haematobacter massiliensis]QEU07655.1 hypothetical protein FOB51_06360 [Paracoccus yeei]
MIMVVASVTIGLTVAPATTTTARSDNSGKGPCPGAETASDFRPAQSDEPDQGANGSISWTISEASPSYSLAVVTERVPSPAWKMTMAAIRVVARLKAKA